MIIEFKFNTFITLSHSTLTAQKSGNHFPLFLSFTSKQCLINIKILKKKFKNIDIFYHI